MRSSGKVYLFVVASLLLLAGCQSAKKVVYMQDTGKGAKEEIKNYNDVKIKAGDLLSIIVSSKTPEAAAIFNLQSSDYQVNATGARIGQTKLVGYLVDKEGNIDFPVLGRLKVAGCTRSELSTYIKTRLYEEDMLKDAVVSVLFQNFKISVLGEVARPNQYTIESDRVSLMDALALAGDLTIYGRRDSVMIIREHEGEREILFANLLSKDVLSNSSYYLQQNDVIYVKPNKIKAQQSGINQNNSVGTWLSASSVLISLAVLIFK